MAEAGSLLPPPLVVALVLRCSSVILGWHAERPTERPASSRRNSEVRASPSLDLSIRSVASPPATAPSRSRPDSAQAGARIAYLRSHVRLPPPDSYSVTARVFGAAGCGVHRRRSSCAASQTRARSQPWLKRAEGRAAEAGRIVPHHHAVLRPVPSPRLCDTLRGRLVTLENQQASAPIGVLNNSKADRCFASLFLLASYTITRDSGSFVTADRDTSSDRATRKQ